MMRRRRRGVYYKPNRDVIDKPEPTTNFPSPVYVSTINPIRTPQNTTGITTTGTGQTLGVVGRR